MTSTPSTISLLNLHPVSFENVSISDGFWLPRLTTLRDTTLPHEFSMLEKHKYIANFELAISGAQEGFSGFVYHDSDLYKVLEAACLSLAVVRDSKVEAQVDRLIDLIARAQMPDGYVNTHFQIGRLDKRWTNLRDWHELYCAGHLIEAAVAHFRATGKRSLLDVAIRFADCIDARFGPNKHEGYPGHPELELALIKLYKATGQRKYFDLARHFVLMRGTKYFAKEHGTPLEEYNGAYWQDRVPIKEWDVIEGHAVRATYLLSAITDLVREEFDSELEAMLQRVWVSAAFRRTYVTGGIGSSSSNEGFTEDYDLPNDTAYQETCASIALAMWNYRMGLLYGDAKYFDVVETALYNGALAGISLNGTTFFYDVPLASKGQHRRQEWFSCACCPPNIARTLAQIGGYAYASSADGIWVNLYIGGSAKCSVRGDKVSLDVDTKYPWDGEVRIRVNPGSSQRFGLYLRVPGWCEKFAVSVNGAAVNFVVERGYAVIERDWNEGDAVELKLEMPVRQIESHPRVVSNFGRLAIARGPIVYCLEGKDAWQHAIPREARFETVWSDELGGFVEIRTSGQVRNKENWENRLYRRIAPAREVSLSAIPFYSWANREPMEMQVWIPTSPPPSEED